MDKEKFSNILKEFLVKMGYGDDIEINSKETSDGTSIEIKTNHSKYLIGEKGTNLVALEFLVKMICQKQNIDANKIFIDVNDYRKEKIKFLKEAAKIAAQKVALTGQPVQLPPMPAFERKIIHSELSINPNITTESEGFLEERRVIVKPYSI